jgi:two-component system, response regulator YesN
LDKNSILIVDDEKLIIKALKANLTREGFNVSTAENVDQALAVIQSKQIDIMLSDYILGNITGLELLKQTKKYHPDIKVIMFSGQKDTLAVEKILAHGADTFIAKPFGMEKLLEEITALQEQ